MNDRDEPEAVQVKTEEETEEETVRAELDPTSETAAERPEADVVEQSRLVEEDQFVDRSTGHDRLHVTVDEADWLDQSVGENFDDDRR